MTRRGGRLVSLLAALALGGVLGCDRAQMADLALTVAFHPDLGRSSASVSEVEQVESQSGPAAVAKPTSRFDSLVSDLESFRELEANAAFDTTSTPALLEQVQKLLSYSVPAADADEALKLAIREAQLAALQAAAVRSPEPYSATAEAFAQEQFGVAVNQFKGANHSAMRILNGYLAAPQLPFDARQALAVHALTYRDCLMNVELYRLLSERLANEGDLSGGVSVAREGMRRCQGAAGVEALDKQVKKIVAKNPASPGFEFQLAGRTAQGKPFDVTSLRGKVVVATFWATWCPECRVEATRLRLLEETYRDDGVAFVGISLDENRDDLLRFAQDNSLTWPQLFVASRSGERAINPFAQYYGVQEIPYTIVVDRDGLIAASGLRGDSQIETAILDQTAK